MEDTKLIKVQKCIDKINEYSKQSEKTEFLDPDVTLDYMIWLIRNLAYDLLRITE